MYWKIVVSVWRRISMSVPNQFSLGCIEESFDNCIVMAITIIDIRRFSALLARVISPFLTGCIRRTYAAIFSFIAGVMPPMPMLGRSLL